MPLTLPRPPEPVRPAPFPLVASLAPVAGSVIIWLVTSSPFVLLFALLGPLVAVASAADSRLAGRRGRRREAARFARELAAAEAAVERAHDRERAELEELTPSVATIVALGARGAGRWRGEPSGALALNLGRGEVESALRFDGAASAPLVPEGEAEEALAQLRADAALLGRAPVVVEAALGIGVCGPPALAAAVARGLLLQVANALPPGAVEFFAPATPAWRWMDALPHSRVAADSEHGVEGAPGWTVAGVASTIAVAPTAGGLPAGCRVVLRVGGARAEVLHTPAVGLEPEFVSIEQAIELAGWLAAAAETAGLRAARREPPSRLAFAELPGRVAVAGPGLPAVFAHSASGPVVVDLVAHGPHAVVGGTTGAGKSELLVSWVLALCRNHDPTALTLLLVDFKGGASFAPVRGLPQVVGVVTDLDERSAHRAMLSLRAELRHRERVIAEAGARSIEELPPGALPRLVIVVDEFAAVLADFPELHTLFADLAARGRSLGVHLVLCTQRPAGVVRDSVLANCALRLSLRVNNRADSIAVVGTDAAAALSGGPPGRACLAIDGEEPRLVQVAIVSAGDVERVALGIPATTPPRRPWRDELPPRLTPEELESRMLEPGIVPPGLPPAAGIALRARAGSAFGLLDLPERQSQEPAIYDPAEHGNLLVLGAGGSGKSVFLATLLLRPNAGLLPHDIEGAWEALTAARDHPPGAGGLLLVDDVDALLARMPGEHSQEFADRLALLLRDGHQADVRVVLTARRATSALQSLAPLCDSRLLLRMPDRQEHVLAGGDPAGYSADLLPGAGEWRGARVQVVFRDPPPRRPPVRAPVLELASSFAVAAARPAEFRARLERAGFAGEIVDLAANGAHGIEITAPTAGARPVAIVGDPETWQSRWALLSSVRAALPFAVEGCGPAELRALTGRRELPPPLAPASGSFWLLGRDGTVGRARLPG